MTNEEMDKKFYDLQASFSKWKDEVVIFINDINDPNKKATFRDLLTHCTVGTATLDINVRTGYFKEAKQ